MVKVNLSSLSKEVLQIIKVLYIAYWILFDITASKLSVTDLKGKTKKKLNMQTLPKRQRRRTQDISVSYLKDINHKKSETKTHSSSGSLNDFLRVQN